VKVVIIGQDPYHTPGQANGLAFSIANGNPIQPSLRNIFKELVSDIGCPMPTTTDLTPWAEEGVLLLNATLTVEAHKANSHSNWGWQTVTSEILKICSQLPQPIVFLAWGNFAHNIIHKIYPEKTTDWREMVSKNHKACLFSPHPSPLSASRGFFGSKPFSYADTILETLGEEPVDWSLP
jgi:uracil-DNA glycosylase